MKHWMTLLGALAFLALAAPLAAQEGEAAGDTIAPTVAEETVAEETVAEETLDAGADETPDTEPEETPDAMAEETPDEAAPDWVFALQPTDNVPEATGNVMVTEGDTENSFVVEVSALPLVDSLDAEGVDVNAYTVWIVPSKEKVKESTLAGVLTVAPEGTGTFESSTALDSFGIIVTATPDGAPAQISGVPVLTGIPVAAPADPAETETGVPAEEEAPAGETPAAEDTPMGEETPAAEPAPEAEAAPSVPQEQPTPEDAPAPEYEPTR